MPMVWKVGMAILIACLVASMAIGIVRLATTPTEILGDDFRSVPAREQAQPETGSPSRPAR